MLLVLATTSTILLGAIAWRMYFPNDRIYEARHLEFDKVVGYNSWAVIRPDGERVRLDFCNNYDVSVMNPHRPYKIRYIRAENRGCLNILPTEKYPIIWENADGSDI